MADPYLVSLDAQIAELKGRIAGLEFARVLYEQVQLGKPPVGPVLTTRGVMTAGATPRPSRLRDTTRMLLTEHPQGLTSRELNNIIAQRDLGLQERSVTSYLSVATKEGQLERDAQGRYRLPGRPEHEAQPLKETEAAESEEAAASGYEE